MSASSIAVPESTGTFPANLTPGQTSTPKEAIEARMAEIHKVLGDGPRQDWMRPLEEEFAFCRGQLSILTSSPSPGKDCGQEEEPAPHGQGHYRDLLQALSRLAGNRQSDGTSSLISREDREAIINGCHDLMISARLSAVQSPQTTVDAAGKAAAFDRIVEARKTYVDAVDTYNARLEIVRAERQRGNWLTVDPEYTKSTEAQKAFWQITQELADAALKSKSPSSDRIERPRTVLPYQKRVRHWMDACFGNEISYDVAERNFRFLEEALELAQSCGATADEAQKLIDYVFSRAIGDTRQEVGGVEVTLAALCNAQGIDLDEAREAELARVWSKVEQIRAKHESKPKGVRSPLPGGADV